MIVSSITGAARREIIPFLQLGAAFEQCEAGVFFVEMNKRFSQQKYDDSKRQEYLDKKQTEEEETRRAHADNRKRKQEYLGRKVAKIPKNIMLPRNSYSYKHMLQTREAWLNLRMKCSWDCTMQS